MAVTETQILTDMNQKIEIAINGKTYPCRPTMGAILRFKRETGREVTVIEPSSISDLLTYLYCCVASASKADRIPFEMSLMDFADAISPDDMNEWAQAIGQETSSQGEEEGADEKKRP